MFDCDQCGKSYTWRDSLARHKRSIHSNSSSKKRKYPNDNAQEPYQPLIKQSSSQDKHNTESASVSDSSLQREDATNVSEQSLINDQTLSVLNDENVPDQQFIVEPQRKDDEKYEQQQCNAFQVDEQRKPIEEQDHSVLKDFLTKIQQSILELKQETLRSNIEEDVARDFQNKQQQDLEMLKQTLFDLKQETMRIKIEEDIAREFQNKQQQDLELFKQTLFDLKQSVTNESAHQVDMEETNDENTQQSCFVRDGAKKKVTKYNKNADDEKLLQIFRDHGYRTDEPSDEEPIDWTAPL